MRPQQIFGLTAAFPLLVVLMALQLDEVRRPAPSSSSVNPLDEFTTLVKGQASLLWQAVSQKQVWLPAVFIFLWQATPSSEGAFFYFITDELGIGPEFLGRVRVGTSLASLLGIWAYRTYLQESQSRTCSFGCLLPPACWAPLSYGSDALQSRPGHPRQLVHVW